MSMRVSVGAAWPNCLSELMGFLFTMWTWWQWDTNMLPLSSTKQLMWSHCTSCFKQVLSLVQIIPCREGAISRTNDWQFLFTPYSCLLEKVSLRGMQGHTQCLQIPVTARLSKSVRTESRFSWSRCKVGSVQDVEIQLYKELYSFAHDEARNVSVSCIWLSYIISVLFYLLLD
jgi:hypothetical protein